MSLELVLKAEPIIKALGDNPVVIVDTETSSKYPQRDGKILAGIGVKPFGGKSFYFPVRHKDSQNGSFRELHKICEALRGRTIIFHNAKFDLAVLYNEDERLLDEYILDTVVMMRLVHEDEHSYELKRLGKTFVKEDAGDQQKQLRLFMKQGGLKTYDQIPAKIIAPYVEEDLVLTEGLFRESWPLIIERNLQSLLALEQKVTRTLFFMERHGFLMDIKYIGEEHEDIIDLVNDAKKEIYGIVKKDLAERLPTLDEGTENRILTEKAIEFFESEKPGEKGKKPDTFNHKSATEVKRIFHGLGIRSKHMTPGGKKKIPQESWAKWAMADLDHPLADMVVKVRALENIEHYYAGFKKLVGKDGVIHCSLHQAGTRTGRLSCREPNLQNVPRFEAYTGAITGAIASMKRLKRKQEERAKESKEKRERYRAAGKTQIAFDDDIAKEIMEEFSGELFGKVRGAFIPRPGCFLFFPDWSQIELRIFADYAGEDELLRTFDLGLDVHRMTALAAFGQLPDPVKEKQMYLWVRNMGKQIAFGLLYGMGIKLLAVEIGKSEEEAQEFMDNYFGRFQNAKKFIDNVVRWCIHRAHGKEWDTDYRPGFVYDRWGRRRYLTFSKAYRAVNFLVQGSAADLMKEAMVRCFEAIQGYDTRLLLTVHDELIFEVPYEEADVIVPLVVNTMSSCERIKCKLKVDTDWSPTRWSDKRSLNCEVCSGKGQIVDQPEDVLLEALFRNDKVLLESVTIKTCDSCEGKGYDLAPIKAHLEEVAA